MIQILLLLVLALSAISLYCIGVVIYNLFFHPLRDYPGPLLARATRCTWAYYSFIGDLEIYVAWAHEEYGEVVRIAPDELTYISSQAWIDIYGFKTTTGQGNLPKEHRGRTQPNGAPTITTANEKDHRRMRRLQAHMFSEKALGEQESLISNHIDTLISMLHQHAASAENNVVDIVKWYNYTTLDIIGDLAFGDSFHCLESDAFDPVIMAIFSFAKALKLATTAHSVSWPLNKLVLYLSPEGIFTEGMKFAKFAYAKARERLAQGNIDRADFMSYILRYNDEKGMTDPEIESNAMVLIGAGGETTASFLSGFTYHLLQNPAILAKVTTLIRTSFATQSEITINSVGTLEYLTACIEEGFRTYPPAATGFPRRTTAGGNIICGRFVPENTVVTTHQWTTYNSARNFTDPKEFIPERWLKDPPEKYKDDNRKVLQPFSFGPRNCLGKNLAYAELRLIFTRIIWNFDLELQDDSLGWEKQKAWIFWEKGPLNIKLIPRKFE